jgi:hypothetical protein
MPGNGAPASGFPTHDVSRDDGWGGAPSPTLPAGGAASDPYYAQGYAPQPTGAYPAEPGYPASQGGDYGAAGLGHAAGYADPLTSAPAYAGGYGSQDNPYAEGVAAPPYPYSYHGANPAQGYDNGQQAEAYQEPGYNGYPSYG